MVYKTLRLIALYIFFKYRISSIIEKRILLQQFRYKNLFINCDIKTKLDIHFYSWQHEKHCFFYHYYTGHGKKK